MNSLAVAAVVLSCSYGAALLGMFLHRRLPVQHLDAESRDVVRLVMGLVATMAALVLGLLVASANSSHDKQYSELEELSADVIVLDRTLAVYGPEAEAVRAEMRDIARQTLDAVWSPAGAHPENLGSAEARAASRARLQAVANLSPTTDTQRMLKAHAFERMDSIAKARLLMFESATNKLPGLLLGILTFWITILFLGFGLLAPFHATMAVALFLGALSVGGAIFLVLELNEPYRGVLQISAEPLRNAVAHLDQ